MHKQMEAILTRVQKPARYVGGEWGSVMKDKKNVDLRFAFCFPDTYEVAMSHLGSRILYGLLNDQKGIWCERVCAPWIDMEAEMRAAGIPLYGLESGDPLTDFDIIAFTLQYELSFSNILNMLDLGGIPVLAKERTDLRHIVACGGPCAYNPEPLADFVDLFMIGDGEEIMLEFTDLYRKAKREGWSKQDFLIAAAQIEGMYVPSLYEVKYHEDGTIESVTPTHGAPAMVQKRIVKDLDESLADKEVLIVEDIIDSGRTLAYLIEVLKQRGPKSIHLCTLLDKPERRVKKQVKVDYTCFTIPDEFVVGYGLDYAQKYRNLPYIGVVEVDQ